MIIHDGRDAFADVTLILIADPSREAVRQGSRWYVGIGRIVGITEGGREERVALGVGIAGNRNREGGALGAAGSVTVNAVPV